MSDITIIELTTLGPQGPQGIQGIQGPQGPAGTGASTYVKFDITTASASWSVNHALGRIPIVQVYLSTGEKIYPDIYATNTNIAVVFAAATTGYIVAE